MATVLANSRLLSWAANMEQHQHSSGVFFSNQLANVSLIFNLLNSVFGLQLLREIPYQAL